MNDALRSCRSFGLALRAAAALLWIGLGPAHGQETDAAPAFEPPRAHPEARYSGLWGKSPFDRISAARAVEAAQEGFAEHWSLAGASRIGGVARVHIVDRTGARFEATGEEADGLRLVELRRDAKSGKTVAVLEKNGERAEVGYAERKIAAAPTRSAPVRPGARAPLRRRTPAARTVSATPPRPPSPMPPQSGAIPPPRAGTPGRRARPQPTRSTRRLKIVPRPKSS